MVTWITSLTCNLSLTRCVVELHGITFNDIKLGTRLNQTSLKYIWLISLLKRWISSIITITISISGTGRPVRIFQRSGSVKGFLHCSTAWNGSNTVKTDLFCFFVFFLFSSKPLPHFPRASKSWSLHCRDLVTLGISVKWENSLNYCPRLMHLQVCVDSLLLEWQVIAYRSTCN